MSNTERRTADDVRSLTTAAPGQGSARLTLADVVISVGALTTTVDTIAACIGGEMVGATGDVARRLESFVERIALELELEHGQAFDPAAFDAAILSWRLRHTNAPER